jgi:hypothetical protein
MATAYTSLLGLALPVTGELSGTWGSTVNDAITSLLDTAVAGTTSITADADITLTTTTGASNQARQAIILWNPASGTVTRNITAPAQSKIYTVINASGGTQSIVFRGAGPTTGVTIIKGESAVVAWNGTDFIKVSNTGGAGSFTNVTISGTTTLSGLTASTALALDASKNVVSVTNTGTGNNVLATSPTLVTPALGTPSALTLTNATGLPVASGISGLGTGVATFLATPSSANLAAAVTDETGSGALVFATSPTLVTPALGTPSSGTVTNLTGTASININGTVGATTANTGAFTTLAASGAVTLSGGTANGVTYLNGSKVLTSGSALTFDGTKLVATATTGAATTYPAYFDNSGAGAGTGTRIGFRNTGASYGEVGYVFSGEFGFVLDSAGSNSTRFLLGGSETMRLTSTGLGIGTSSPAYKLDVYGTVSLGDPTISGSARQHFVRTGGGVTSNTTNGLTFKPGSATATDQFARFETGTGTFIGAYGNVSDNLSIWTRDTSNAVTLTQSGNLGLGVTPSAWVTTTTSRGMQFGRSGSIFYSTDQAIAVFGNNYCQTGATTYTYLTTGYAQRYSQSDFNGDHIWYNAPSGTAGNVISFTQAMTLDAGGNLLVGTTSALVSSAGRGNITVNGSSSSILSFGIAGASSGYLFSATDGMELASVGATYVRFSTNGSERARIDSSGNLLVGTTDSTASSGVGIKSIYSATVPQLAVVVNQAGANAGISLYNTNAGAYRFYADNTGTLHATSTVISAISDKRLKENVRDIDTGLNSIMALKPRRFDWKEGKGQDKKNVAGFIAQEFEAVFPECVGTTKAGADGIEYKNINHETLIPTLVKAIQELKAEFDAYKSTHP